MSNNKHMGSSMGSLFDELGEQEELDLLTRKKIISEQLTNAMKHMRMSKSALAEAMNTSRTVIHRLLDPSDTSVTLHTLAKASKALNLRLEVGFNKPKRAA